jgi:glutamate-ammonia-ligase adenylyltransferase
MEVSHLPEVLTGARLECVLHRVEECCNSDQTAVRLGRVLSSPLTHPWIDRVLFHGNEAGPLLSILCQIVSQSEFLASILEREPGLLTSFTSERDFSFSSGRAIFEKELHSHLTALKPDEPYKLGLCRFKLHELFRIAVRDITRQAPIEVLARELSDLADVILQAAYEKVYAQAILAFGAPLGPDQRLLELAVLSLGKHGSRELNFSSDLDLILVYPQEGKTSLERRAEAFERWLEDHPYARFQADMRLPARTRPVEFETFFTEVGTRLIELLSEPGPLGVIYRIDMRLRPEGSAGPLVRTLESALQYYHNWGQRWERQALIRARLSAGDAQLGAAFLREVGDFIFRKYVDSVEVDETLREMRELRFRSIARSGSDPKSRQRNLKNGPGGIRDVEFLAQAVQTLYGGEYPEFQHGTIFEILRRIHQSGLISAQDYTLLSNGYEVLRRLEHRVQMDDMQKYHLPLPGFQLETMARGLEFDTGAALETRLFETMERIHAIFQTVFRTEESEMSVGNLLDQPTLTPQWRDVLLANGLKDPESVFRSLGRLATDEESPHLNSKLRRLLKAILPRLLATVRDTPSPGHAWRMFEAISLATHARSSFFTMAQENPQIIGMLVTIGSASPILSDVILSSLNFVDDLIHHAAWEDEPPTEDLASAFRDQGFSGGRWETPLGRLRSFRTRNEIQIAGRFVLGRAGIVQISREISRLARFCLENCIKEVGLDEREMIVLGLGKFGGMELGFASDLDLLIFYDSHRQTDSEIPQKLASSLAVEMGARTPDGRLFPIDVRLRPHGKNAPLVLSLQGALDYYQAEGQTWERLALTRCLPIWGSPEVLGPFHTQLLRWVHDTPTDEQVLAEVLEMRRRIEREKGDQILKAGPGGLLDVEFIAQAGQLRWGGDEPSVRSPNTLGALDRLRAIGALTATENRTLREGYEFLREVENRLALLGKPGSKGIPKDAETLDHLIGCLNTARKESGEQPAQTFTQESLQDRDQQVRSRIREIFEDLFSRAFEKAWNE